MGSKDQNRVIELPDAPPKPMERSFTWDEVKQYVDENMMERAEYVARLLSEFSQRYGDEVYEIASQVIYRIGFEKGQQLAASVKNKSFKHVTSIFSDPAMINYFGFRPEYSEESAVAEVHYCPLPRQWKKMGMTDEEIIKYCEMFEQADKGIFEGYSDRFTCLATGAAGFRDHGYCQMTMGVIPKK